MDIVEQSQQTQLTVTPHPGLPLVVRAKRPDRDARNFLRVVNAAPAGNGYDVPVETLRKVSDAALHVLGTHHQMHEVLDISVTGVDGNNIPVRIYYPEAEMESAPALLWVFGGGFVVGSIDTGSAICRSIAKQAGCIVVAVQYRLVPDVSILQCREDANSVLEWMKAEGEHFGMDVSRLAVGGDSAGGNISAALAQRHKDLMLQLLVYPATELAATYPSFEENMDGRYLLDESALTTLAPHVSKGCEGLDLTDNWLNPARLEDCSGLPPAMIVTCGFDPIRDHGLDYSSRLRIAGVPVQLVHYAGQFHGFINFDTINSAARNFLEQASDAMRRAAIGEYFDSTVEVRDGDSYQSFTGGLISSSLMTWESVTRWRRKLTPKKLKSVSKVWDTCTDHLRAELSKRLDKLEVTETYCGAA